MKALIKLLVTLALVAGAYMTAKKMIESKPAPRSKQPRTAIPIVDASHFKPGSHAPKIKSFGTIRAYDQTTITSQVSGRITELSSTFRTGARIKAGEFIAQIDQADYKAAFARESANLINAQRTLAEEEVRSKQAKEDWLLSGRKLEEASPFVLRTPQRAAAKANVSSAMAAVEKAQTDLKRTRIEAPFDAIVQSRDVSKGRFVNAQAPIGSLLATDKVELRIPLTTRHLQRLASNKLPFPITLTDPQRSNVTWQASVTRIDPNVDPTNQVSYYIAEVTKPFADPTRTLNVGTFVNASLSTKAINGCYALPDAAIVNDSFVWVATLSKKPTEMEGEKDSTPKKQQNSKGKDKGNKKDKKGGVGQSNLPLYSLRKVDVETLFSAEGLVYCKLIDKDITLDGSHLIVTRPLTSFREGIEVRVKNAKQPEQPETSEKSAPNGPSDKKSSNPKRQDERENHPKRQQAAAH